jgi:chemotaxis protein MotB
MSDSENHHHGKNEIIIIKRHGGGDHDGAHGGAWKIAYADFMTALMAFFLVMWLVNAANEETKASVATYFNPIKLSDEKPTEKGLKKPVDQADGEEKADKSKEKEDQPNQGASAASGEDQTSTSGDQKNYSEADFFENPYSVLAEIAQEVGQQANVSAKGEGGAADSGPATGADGGEAYRDPFDPDFWTKQVEVTRADKTQPDDPDKEAIELAKASEQAKLDQAEARSPENITNKTNDKTSDKTADKDGVAPETKTEAEKAVEQQQEAKDLQQQIAKQIGGIAGKLAEGLTVTPAEGGLLVSISDQSDDSMFNVGSAVPRKEMVLAMQKIGEVLKDRGGVVVIRGHTDGRQYKGENANWRLSMDRAEAAYYMMVRGGLEEKRVSQVSGFADRKLKDVANPLDASNRRIEILIQADQG